jgi:single-stranded-DNA-specific exonuclease
MFIYKKFHLIEQRKPLDIVFTLEENDFNGDKSLQIKVIDVALSEAAPIVIESSKN